MHSAVRSSNALNPTNPVVRFMAVVRLTAPPTRAKGRATERSHGERVCVLCLSFCLYFCCARR